MTSQLSYHRNGNHPRSYYPSLASINSTDSGRMYGPSREMGPPPLDSPPQPVEIDLNSSRTLPSPSASAPNAWDLQSHGIGDITYGSSTVARMQQIPVEGQIRGPPQDPLGRWYLANDGPWMLTEVIPEAAPEERSQSRHIGNRNPLSYRGQYQQQNQSDAGSVQFGVHQSDSGYGTRRSVGNTSVFSADVNERDQDSQSLIGQGTDYHPFQFNDMFQSREVRAGDSWTAAVPSSSAPGAPGLVCTTCQKPVKTQSELKKHNLRHTKPFVCKVPGCPRKEGFSTTNDLERHTKSKHPSAIPESASTKKFRCRVPGCKSKEKSWPRLDNFRSHLKRVHQNQLRGDEETDDMIRSGEFWEKSNIDIDPELTARRSSLTEPSRPSMPSVRESQTRLRRPEHHWKTPYPQVIEPSHDLISRSGSHLDTPGYKATTPDEKNCQAQRQDTVQPLEIFPGVPEKKPVLDNILLAPIMAPAGHNASAITKVDRKSPQPASKAATQGKAPRQNEVSASDAVLTEVIKIALAGPKIAETSADASGPHALERSNLPNGKTSPHHTDSVDPNPAMSGRRGAPGIINHPTSPPSDVDSTDSDVEKKALEILKTIRDHYHILEKEPSHSPKPHNTGSVASNKSTNQVTCPTCKNFTGRPCELKKHMKRHERPYGCTFLTCSKTFGSKNDWKRHENSQHYHLETWRCDEERPEGGACAKVCYRRQSFQDHLKRDHQLPDDDNLKTKLEDCRIGRNCQARFWCGFCTELIVLKKKGLEAWAERFDHIDDHFMGRKPFPKQSIQDWVPVDSDKPRGNIESPHSMDGSSGKDSPQSEDSAAVSPDGKLPESAGAPGGSATDATILEEPKIGTKRDRTTSDDEDQRPAKIARTSPSSRTVIYCCQCEFPHNPKVDSRCSNCEDSHEFCDNCGTEFAAPEES